MRVSEVFRGEEGFTLVELFVSMAIVSILAAIAYTSFALYKENAEYSKAEVDIRNALTAAEVGDQDAVAGMSIGLTTSGKVGGPVVGALAAILPGMVTTEEVQLSASYSHCAGAGPFDVKHQIIAQPCKADRYTSYISFCGGIQLLQRDLALPAGTC